MSDLNRPAEHHVHRESDPLPGSGAKGAATSFDYSAGMMEKESSALHLNSDSNPQDYPDTSETQGGQNAFNSERPLDVRPAPEGGVAISGQSGLPEGKAGFADKLIGKTQKVVGKAMNKPEMHEKGELRETGGKGAAAGDARAAHD